MVTTSSILVNGLDSHDGVWRSRGVWAWIIGGVILSVLCAFLLGLTLLPLSAINWVFMPIVMVPMVACAYAARSVVAHDRALAKGWWWACASGGFMLLGHVCSILGGNALFALGSMVAFLCASMTRVLCVQTMIRPRPSQREQRNLWLDLLLIVLVGMAILCRSTMTGHPPSFTTLVVILAGALPVAELAVMWTAWWACRARSWSSLGPAILFGCGAFVFFIADLAAFFNGLAGIPPGVISCCGWVLGLAFIPAAAAAQVRVGAASGSTTQVSTPIGQSPMTVTVGWALVLVLIVVFFTDRLPRFDLVVLLVLVVVVLLRMLAVLQERERLTRRIREMRDSLEARVHQRTIELDRSNAGLRQEVTERRRIESSERDSRTTAEALQRASQAVNSSLDLDEVMDRILAVLRQSLPHAAASIILVEAGMARVLRRHGWEASDAFPRSSFPVSDFQDLGQLLEHGRPVLWDSGHLVVNGLVPHESWMRSVVGVRLRSHDQAVGAIVLASTVQHEFGPQHIARLDAFSEHMGMAIGNARSFAMINRRAVRLAQLGELSASLARSQDLPTVERVAVEGLAQTLGAERATLLRVDASGQVNPTAVVGANTAALETHGGVLSVLRGAHWFLAPEATFLVVPVRIRGDNLAVIVVESGDEYAFATEDVEHATTIAHLLAARTEQARLFAGERAARVAAEDASRHKSEFLANTTHELRTPLTGVLLALDLARDGMDGVAEAQRQDLLATAQESAQRLLETINGILDLSKIEAGRMEAMVAAVDVAAVAQEVVRTLQVRALGAGIELTIAGNGQARADQELVRRILFNLVGNGLKFTERGSVGIRISQLSDIVIVVVEDTGIGVELTDQGRLFTPFTQVDGSTSRRYEGTGLGLAISRRMADLMGGTLNLSSLGRGQGTTLTLTLPAA